MADRINTEELVRIAGNIEKDGEAFYREAAELVAGAEDKKLFTELADWEAEHYATFTAMLKNIFTSEFDSEIDVMNEAALYLQAILGGDIFTAGHTAAEISSESEQGIDGIFKFAIEREKDSIVFYTALEKVVDAMAAKSELDKIIAEEISHVRFLTAARKRHFGH